MDKCNVMLSCCRTPCWTVLAGLTGITYHLVEMNRDRVVTSTRGAVDTRAVEPLTGRTVGDFAIGEAFQSGGFGVIYHAVQRDLDRAVVVKVLRQRRADDAGTKRFLREAQLASQLDHPYAAHIYAFGAEPDGVMWIAMELVRGTSMKELLERRGSLPLSRLVPLLEKLAEVIYSAHQQGIIHRDIKPSNVMVLSRAGRLLPKLLDLGIARMVDDPQDGALAVDASSDDDSSADDADLDWPFDPVYFTGSSDLETLTHGGVSLGSPPYMAPEQWASAAQANARTDQYALAVLTYEAITGRRPFPAQDVRQLSLAHRHNSVPPLGEEFPKALQDVIDRAMAKDPAQRFDNVIEFARAVREASGLDVETDLLPQLDADLREALLARAPQPLADSVAALEAAREPLQALETAFQVIRVAVRLIGVASVAALTRFGPGDSQGDTSLREALLSVHRKVITSRDWLDICRALTAPFARAPDDHPIPELVLLFHGAADGTRTREDGDQHREAGLYADLVEVEPYRDRDDSRAALQSMLPILGRLLGRLAFLCDYRMVAQHRGCSEVWMGARRSVRPQVTVWGYIGGMCEGEVALIGSDGDFLLSLSPLCQLLAPAPGAPAEVFLFAGRSSFGARLVSFPIGFESHDGGFWDWYRDHLCELDETLGAELNQRSEASASASRAPYKGLAAFSADDSDNYFGREREVRACVNRLCVDPLLVIVGPSGAGKSSFVQAGILPALPRDCQVVTVRPGPAPMQALSAVLARELLNTDNGAEPNTTLHQQISTDSGALGTFLHEMALAGDRQITLIIDQFEELLTLGCDLEERRMYSAALMNAARPGQSRVRVVIAIRDDFLLRAQQLPALRERLGQALQLIATPPPEELERILVEPARRVGYEFEDDDLPEEMVSAIADEPGALALLSFTAAKLWDRRDRHFKRLRRDAYHKLGGVGGALAQHAEAMLEAMPDEHRSQVREVFRQLVTADGTRAILTRRELTEMLGAGADHTLEHLIGSRLLVASEGADGEDRVEVVHEALLSSWPRLVGWQREDAESARLRDQLRTAARQWVARDRAKGLLWRDDALMEYRVWRARYRGALTEDEERFASASLDAQARGQKRRRLLVIAAFTALVVGLLITTQLKRQADRERGRARAFATESQQRLLALYQEQGRLASLAGDSERALAYLLEAFESDADSPALRFLLARTGQALADLQRAIPAHDGQIWSVRFSPDGTQFASAGFDHIVKIWDANTGQLLWSFTDHEMNIWFLNYNHDGTRLVSASFDNTARVWNPQTGQVLWTARHPDKVNWAGFTNDGHLLGTTGREQTLKLWDGQDGAPVRTIELPSRPITAGFSPDGALVATGTADGITRIWNVATGDLVTQTETHGGMISYVEFSPDGALVASASWGQTASIIAILGGPTRMLTGHDDHVTKARFSPDGERLLTTGEDKSSRVWDVASGTLVHTLEGHTGGIVTGRFSADGKRIMTFGRDATGRIWDTDTGRLLWTYLGATDAIWTAAVHADTGRLVTGSMDGMVHVWDVPKTGYRLALPAQETAVKHAVLGPGGSKIATARTTPDQRVAAQVWSRDGQLLGSVATQPSSEPVRRPRVAFHPDGTRLLLSGGPSASLWALETNAPLARFGDHGGLTYHAVFSPDGGRIITGGKDGTATVWNATDGTELMKLTGHQAPVVFVDVDTHGTRIITASRDRSVRMWDAATASLLTTLQAQNPQPFTEARFADDDTLIIGASDDKNAVIWNSDGQRLVTLEGHSDAIASATVSPDDQLVATASEDGTVKLWDIDSGRLLWSTAEHPGEAAWSVEFSASGNALLVARGRTVSLWDMEYDSRTPEQIRAFAACRLGFALQNGHLDRVQPDYQACASSRAPAARSEVSAAGSD